MREQIIMQLQSELHALQKTKTTQEFDKHLYAIHKLSSLSTMTEKTIETQTAQSSPPPLYQTPPLVGETRAVTDDGFGNGESLFDF